MNPRHPIAMSLLATVVAIAGVFLTQAAGAIPPRGSEAPPIELKDLNGGVVLTSKLAPRTLVLIFGEIGHEGAKQACADVLDVLTDPRLSGSSIVPILVVAQDTPTKQLRDQASQGRYPAVILHDPKRDTFGAYRVLVVPTVVVVDGTGKVVHAMPGFLQRFKEILTESLLVSSGKAPREQLDRVLEPKAQEGAHEAVRADRLVHLGNELTRHGLYEVAEARFTEANSLSPGHIGAKLGLGELMLRQNRLADAEALFKSVLSEMPDSTDAALGIAAVQQRNGGDDIAKAESSVKAILEKDPRQPRARFLMGQIYEAKGNTPAALAEYKKAAELLLER